MQLWNEYEGRIVADQFPLKKLLEPEGRSAFFSTIDSSGTPAVLRLIEAHFDEPEILARWNAVAKIDQQNLIRLGKFGETTLDETALLYAVMEPADGSLADILRERPLSAKETMQIATSLVPALTALHANNLVHEHVVPANVLAIGEVVKLRSDCIREAPEGAEAGQARARDIHDLSIVLLQALTQKRSLPAVTNLPAPFNDIVGNGISGVWGLPQIAAALESSSPAPKRPIPSAPNPPAAKSTTYTPPPAKPEPERRAVGPVTVASALASRKDIEDEPRRVLPWTTIAAAVILAIFIGWHFLHKAPAPIPTLATMPGQSAPTVAAAKEVTPAPTPAKTTPSATGPRTQWRVVAYTYNHENQAQEKVAQIISKDAALRPEVFAPRGRAPYLVTVGGSLSHDEAMAFRKKARSSGLPRDTYAQNFPANAR